MYHFSTVCLCKNLSIHRLGWLDNIKVLLLPWVAALASVMSSSGKLNPIKLRQKPTHKYGTKDNVNVLGKVFYTVGFTKLF